MGFREWFSGFHDPDAGERGAIAEAKSMANEAANHAGPSPDRVEALEQVGGEAGVITRPETVEAAKSEVELMPGNAMTQLQEDTQPIEHVPATPEGTSESPGSNRPAA